MSIYIIKKTIMHRCANVMGSRLSARLLLVTRRAAIAPRAIEASFCRRGLECFPEYNSKWIGWKHLLHPIPFLPCQSSSQENARGEECSDFTLTRHVFWGLRGASPHNTGLQNSLNVFSSVFGWTGIIHCKPRQNSSAKQSKRVFQCFWLDGEVKRLLEVTIWSTMENESCSMHHN
jgi:hypothetical protein